MPKIGRKPQSSLTPFWATPDGRTVRVYDGDSKNVLERLPSGSVHTVVTSPPYWGLRDYGMTDQLGAEERLEDYVERLSDIFDEVHRVLRDDGTLWLNLGDSYVSSKQSISAGNLAGIPWRVALALQERGWVLRQDIIWAKPSPMPESITNRCTKAHEYFFMFTKKKSGYYYDHVAIQEKSVDKESEEGRRVRNEDALTQSGLTGSNYRKGFAKIKEGKTYPFRNKRSVWRVPFENYPGSHFATFPRNLVRPAILSSTSERGCCGNCGAPYRRVTETKRLKRGRSKDFTKRDPSVLTDKTNACPNTVAGIEVATIGWTPGCECEDRYGVVIPEAPCVVLDPFAGSGTTCCVALEEGRYSIGIELNRDYITQCLSHRVEGTILSRPSLRHLSSKKPVEIKSLGDNLL